jgi:N-acetylglucosaminyl-diphospho-decaprenol L-rhamnosyltransferase
MPSATSPDPAVRVAVVTVSFGSGSVLVPFLDSIADSTAAEALIVVADNKADIEGSVRELVSQLGAQYVAMQGNAGYGAAANRAIESLPEDIQWVLVSNPDVLLGVGALDTMLAAAAENPTIGSVGPLILTAEGEVYPSARAVPSLRTGVGHALFVNLWTANPWTRAYRKDAQTSLERRNAGWLSGACLLVRRSAFEELGGFDSGFFMYFEDVDLGYRLGKAGYRNLYVPAATVTHTGAHATTTDSERMIRIHHESARRFLGKKYAGALLWPVRAVLRVGLWLRSTLIVRRLHR